MKKALFTSLPAAVLLLTVLSGATTASAQDFIQGVQPAMYNSYGTVSFYESDEPTPPVDPENPDPNKPLKPMDPDGTNPNPGTGGTLSIDFASSFDFGVHKIENTNQIYLAQAQKYFDTSLITPDFVQVTDSRGTLGGWVLKVKENSQFRAVKNVEYNELSGAALSLTSPKVVSNNHDKAPTAHEVINLVPGSEALVMNANPGEGAGTWITRWGNSSDLNYETTTINGKTTTTPYTKAVTLSVPGATPKDPVSYKTTLLWILSDLPTNN
ncbi:MAG: WxL domain-containing protein [Streptococcaceae bacterium]|jgi:hypothetical protein|nr:WxL domain-containing protein [Streptococcaceae bacterium]